MRQFRPSVALFGIAVIYFVAGCGGNGSAGIASTTTGGSTGGAANPTNNVTATVHVNVKTGQVTIAPVAGVINTKVFQGNRIGFNYSVLLDEPGDVGRKVLKVSLVNHSSESIGVDPNGNVAGLRVVFGTFTNSVSIPDLRPQTQVSTFAGTGVAGFADGGTSAAQFNAPVSVATTADGSVYVADQGNNKIRKISNGYVSTFAGNGTAAEVDGLGGSASFKTPLGIAINPVDGSLIVGDYGGNKIRRITTAGRVYTIAGTGATGGNNATGNSATFDRPWAVSTDQYGHIYVTEDSGRIRKIFLTAGANPNLSGSYTVVTFAGAGGAGSFADGIGVNAHFNGPHGVAVDPSGNVYIADQFNNRIRFIGAGAEVVTIAGDGTIVDLDGTGDVATLGNPSGIVWYNGALFVTESDGSRVRELFPNKGAPLANASSWNVTSLAGNGAPAVQDGQGDSAEFNRPNALAVDKSGGLLVVAQLENTVRRVIPSSGFFPLGIPVGGTPPAEPVTLANPTGIVANSFNPFITYAGSIAAGATSPSLDWVFTIPSGVSAFQFTVSVIADSAHIAQVKPEPRQDPFERP